MATSKVTFSEVEAFYELCTSGTDIKGFCVQQGANYPKFQTWRRKQLWNEKAGKTGEITPLTLNAVKITNVPVHMKSTDNPIRYIQAKFPEGVMITRTYVSTDEVITLLTKYAAVLC